MSSRIRPVTLGTSADPAIEGILQFSKSGFGDTHMFGVMARRPELLKRIAGLFDYFLGGGGGIIDPALLEVMRLRGAHLNACTYCATVRLGPVQEQVRGKEKALGVADVSRMTKQQALDSIGPKLDPSGLSAREALAVRLVDRLVEDPHRVDDAFFAELRKVFSEEEIIEMVIASALFTLAGAFNTTVRLGTDGDGRYSRDLAYATEAVRVA